VPINTVRDLLPQLRNGKVIRGRIGVTVTQVPREDYQEFGLKTRSGAIVASVTSGGAAAKAGNGAGRRHRAVQRPAGHQQRRAGEDGGRHQAGHQRAGQGAAQQAGEKR
jgi:hypothetical protein